MSGKKLFLVSRHNIAGPCQQTFENKKFVDNTKQCFAFTLQANFLANNLRVKVIRSNPG